MKHELYSLKHRETGDLVRCYVDRFLDERLSKNAGYFWFTSHYDEAVAAAGQKYERMEPFGMPKHDESFKPEEWYAVSVTFQTGTLEY